MPTGWIGFQSLVQRIAMLSLHTSPLAQPGSGDSGGMNVYVREVASSLAQAGVQCTTYTRRTNADQPDVVEVEPGHRVVHIDAGPAGTAKGDLLGVVGEFGDRVVEHLTGGSPADVVHANYWLSGLVAHRIKHQLDLPFVSTFHTLAKVKGEGGDTEPDYRHRAEAEIIGCADAICVSCTEEAAQFRRLYGEPPGRIEIVAPGVEHALFAPGKRAGARTALGLPDGVPIILFVGRIQPLKGVELAVATLGAMAHRDAVLVIVGGVSGVDGHAELARARSLASRLGVAERIRFVDPQPHHILSSYYRAADLVIVPSRSESFGLVALEAAACGTPVVASAVGGLLNLVDDGDTGFLIEDRDPARFAAAADLILADPAMAAAMAAKAAERAGWYTWGIAATRLQRVYDEVRSARQLVACS